MFPKHAKGNCRAVARSENLGGHIVLGGDNVPPLVEIGLTDLPKSGGARAPPASHLAACLQIILLLDILIKNLVCHEYASAILTIETICF